jgi:hypothetical protein
MQEKYGIISFFDKIVIDLRDFILIISEKSSSDRYSHTLLLWHLIDLLRDSEKCEVRDMRAWDLECLEKSRTLLISYDDEVSFLEYFSEHHLMLHLLDLERYAKVYDRRTRQTCDLGTEIPLIQEARKIHSLFIIE